jgi:hypothetical protein
VDRGHDELENLRQRSVLDEQVGELEEATDGLLVLMGLRTRRLQAGDHARHEEHHGHVDDENDPILVRPDRQPEVGRDEHEVVDEKSRHHTEDAGREPAHDHSDHDRHDQDETGRGDAQVAAEGDHHRHQRGCDHKRGDRSHH